MTPPLFDIKFLNIRVYSISSPLTKQRIYTPKPNSVKPSYSNWSFLKPEWALSPPSLKVSRISKLFLIALFPLKIKAICRSAMFIFRNLNILPTYFSRASFETALHAFVTSRLDYCNSLFAGLLVSTLRLLQLQ